MAKLETDFSEYTGAHIFYIFIPIKSLMGIDGRRNFDNETRELYCTLDHTMYEYVINSAERVIGYVDADNMCHVLSNNSEGDVGFNGTLNYYLRSPLSNDTLQYKEQTSIETNVLSGYVGYDKGNGETVAVIPTDIVNLSFNTPTTPQYNENTSYSAYVAEYPSGKLGWNMATVTGATKDTTNLVVHTNDTVYGTICPVTMAEEAVETHSQAAIGSSEKAWLEQRAIEGISALNSAPVGNRISHGINWLEVGTSERSFDSNAIILNLILTKDYDAALKFLQDGTIPADAKVNVKKDKSEEDSDNENGEDGNRESTFDENEPSAPTVNSVKLSNLHNYWITQNQMQSFYSSVWDTDLTDFVKGAFTGIYSNLISNVVSLKFMPTTAENLGGTGDTSPVILGFKTYDDLTVQTIGNTTAPIVNIGSYKFAKEYNSFADYAPYTDVKLYLPFVGVVPIDTNLFMGSGGGETATLNIKAQYDLQSGLITYFIMRNKTMISSVSGRMAVEVPISLQSGLDTFSTISRNFVGKAMSFAGNIATGNPIGMVADIAQGSATSPPQTVFASTGGDGAFYSHPKCMIMIRHPQYNRPKNYSHVVGFPAYVTKKVNDLQGFNIVQNPVIPLADGMTGAEHDMIVTAMQSGLYY